MRSSWRAWLSGPSLDERDAEAFAEHCRAVTRRNVRNGCVALAAVVVLAWPLDLLLDPTAARGLAVFRIVSVALALAYALGFTRIRALARRPQLAWSGIVAIALVGCLCNAERAGLDLPWIDHTYLLPFVTLLGLERLARRLAITAAVVGAFVLAYFALFPAQLASANAWSFVVIMSVAWLVSVTVGHIVQHLSARQFTLTRELDRANDELEQRVALQTRELHALTDRITRLHAAERGRVAEELGGRAERLVERMRLELRALASSCDDTTTIDRLVGLTDELRSSTSAIVSTLGPELGDGDLAANLQRLLSTTRSLSPATLTAEIDPSLTGLDPTVAWAAYRIAQEALTNAVRHATPSRVLLRATRRGRGMIMEIEDDGVGIRAPTAGSRRGHGLATMRERAQRCGATLEIDAPTEGGTRVRFTLADLG